MVDVGRKSKGQLTPKNILTNPTWPRNDDLSLADPVFAHVDFSRRDTISEYSTFFRGRFFLQRAARRHFPGAPHATASECERRVAASVRDEPPRRVRPPERLGTQHRAGTRAPIDRHRVGRDEGEGKIFGRVRASPSNARESGMKVMRDLPRAFGMSPPGFGCRRPALRIIRASSGATRRPPSRRGHSTVCLRRPPRFARFRSALRHHRRPDSERERADADATGGGLGDILLRRRPRCARPIRQVRARAPRPRPPLRFPT